MKDNNNSNNNDNYNEDNNKGQNRVPVKELRGDAIDQNEAKRSKRKFIVEPLISIFILGVLMQYTVQSQYILYFTGKTLNPNYTKGETVVHKCTSGSDVNKTLPEYNFTRMVQTEAAQLNTYNSVISNVISLFVTPLYSVLSDKTGRRFPLLLAVSGTLVHGIINSCTIYFKWSLWVLVSSTAITSLTGGMTTVISISFAYIAASCTKEKRNIRMIILEAVLAISIMVAELTVGFWIQYYSYLQPYIFGTCCHAAVLLYTIFLVPEVRELNVDFKKGSVSLHQSKELYKVYLKPGRNTVVMVLMMVVSLLVNGVLTSTMTLQSSYVMSYPFCLPSSIFGVFAAVSILIYQFGGIFIAIFMKHRRLKTFFSSLIAIIVGLASGFLAKVLFGFATSIGVLFLVPIIGMFSMMPSPFIRSFLSLQVPQEELGALFASVSLFDILSSLIGAPVFNTIYEKTFDWFAGFVFLMVAAIQLISLIIVVYVRHRVNQQKKLNKTVMNINETIGQYEELKK